jgi:hypothetical protein
LKFVINAVAERKLLVSAAVMVQVAVLAAREQAERQVTAAIQQAYLAELMPLLKLS